jgi:hypothetical protein
MERAVHGSPDGLSVGELHERALKIVQQTFSAPLKKVMEEFDEYRGANSVRFGIEEILKAAWDGRVADLLIREDAERLGVCDDGAPQVQVGSDSRAEDLLNLAAVWTVSQKGQAFALQTSDMPEGADAAAILRY